MIENIVETGNGDSDPVTKTQKDTVQVVGAQGELQGYSIKTTSPDGTITIETINLVKCEDCL